MSVGNILVLLRNSKSISRVDVLLFVKIVIDVETYEFNFVFYCNNMLFILNYEYKNTKN